jgi:hypothetical protein
MGDTCMENNFRNLFLKILIKCDFRKEGKFETLYNKGGRRMKDLLLLCNVTLQKYLLD